MQYLAEFRRFYPGEFRHACYSTRDRVIPFLEFWEYYECIGPTQAQERVNEFRAIANALACLFAEKGAPMLPALRDDLVAAYLAAPDSGPRPLIKVVSR